MTREYPDRPLAGVGAVIFRQQSVLLVRRNRPPLRGGWSLPGGAQELGETASQALLREIREETGLKVDIKGFLELVDFIDRDDEGATKFHYVLADFWGVAAPGNPRPGSDVSEARFVPLDSLDEYDLWSKTREVIEKAAKLHAGSKAPRHSFKGHLRTALLALLFGMGAYGFIHALIALLSWLR